jgi:dTDP-glucose pyrophosphorylase
VRKAAATFSYKKKVVQLMELFYNFSPEEILALATAIALTLAKDRKTEEVEALGSFFEQIGQSLDTLAAQRELLEKREEKLEEIEELKKKIKELKKKL